MISMRSAAECRRLAEVPRLAGSPALEAQSVQRGSVTPGAHDDVAFAVERLERHLVGVQRRDRPDFGCAEPARRATLGLARLSNQDVLAVIQHQHPGRGDRGSGGRAPCPEVAVITTLGRCAAANATVRRLHPQMGAHRPKTLSAASRCKSPNHGP